MQQAIDIHSHMLCEEWLTLFRAHSGARFSIREVVGGKEVIHYDGIAFMTPEPRMFDYAERIESMDAAGVDMAVLSLTGPNVYWGDEDASARAARAINRSFAQAQADHPQRLRWIASLPFQYPARACEELARALDDGARGVMVLGNIGGESLTAPRFASVWAEIDRRALPVFLHPTVPCGCAEMDIAMYQLSASVGFTFDSTLAVTRMIFDGFFDRYPRMKLIIAHGGGTLPFLAPRLDRCHEVIAAARTRIAERPSTYLKRLYADSVLYSHNALRDTLEVFGEDHVLFGSDYPHNISDMTGILARIDALPADLRDKLRGGNARRVFDIQT
ncbi:MAG: amidohydrolase [Proteobacteria bacterium]|nr:amidohydrolase [Burkholderiales bacterium]